MPNAPRRSPPPNDPDKVADFSDKVIRQQRVFMKTPERGDELVFLPLGGSGEIGMNFNAYGYGPESDRQWIIVDCGVLFGREGNTPGVDLLMPDIRYLAERSDNVLAIIATH